MNNYSKDQLSEMFSDLARDVKQAIEDDKLYRQNPQLELDKYGVKNLTPDELHTLLRTSNDTNFLQTMDKLKQDDIIEFTLKLKQFDQSSPATKLTFDNTSNQPKCPTCGSTDVKPISGVKRWITTGAVGIASSDMGKTYVCNKCKCKW